MAQTPWFDAGQQAMILHQGDLLEQQTAPVDGDAEDSSDGKKPSGEARKVASPKSVNATEAAEPDKDKEKQDATAARQEGPAAGLVCSMARERERLRPEYERRVRQHGEQAANAWLRQEAAALGQRAGEQAKAGMRC